VNLGLKLYCEVHIGLEHHSRLANASLTLNQFTIGFSTQGNPNWWLYRCVIEPYVIIFVCYFGLFWILSDKWTHKLHCSVTKRSSFSKTNTKTCYTYVAMLFYVYRWIIIIGTHCKQSWMIAKSTCAWHFRRLTLWECLEMQSCLWDHQAHNSRQVIKSASFCKLVILHLWFDLQHWGLTYCITSIWCIIQFFLMLHGVYCFYRTIIFTEQHF